MRRAGSERTIWRDLELWRGLAVIAATYLVGFGLVVMLFDLARRPLSLSLTGAGFAAFALIDGFRRITTAIGGPEPDPAGSDYPPAPLNLPPSEGDR